MAREERGVENGKKNTGKVGMMGEDRNEGEWAGKDARE
jgi:hypothetical protein